MIPIPQNLDLAAVSTLMRNLSQKTDPQEAARMYGQGLEDLGLIPEGEYVSLSRRNLEYPYYRVTRSWTWKEDINPWKQPERLPVLKGGLFAKLIYANEPTIIEDLPSAFSPDDPAAEYLGGGRMQKLVSLPHFEGGESLNLGILVTPPGKPFPTERVPIILFLANLWGRATSNLVTRQKLEAAYAAMDHELTVVAQIQHSLLPRELPVIPGVELAAHYQTSQRAGGDYYDFFPLPENRWGIFVADVSGHGTPAAVIMAITHAIAHTRPGHPMPPPVLLDYVNRILAGRYTTNNGTFVTAFYGVLDPHARHLTYSSAGHPPPRLIRNRNISGLNGETSLPLGIEPREPYLAHECSLQPGDQLLFYTDGVPDAFSPQGDSFGLERLDQALRPSTSADSLIQNTLSALKDFCGTTPINDDRTLVALALR